MSQFCPSLTLFFELLYPPPPFQKKKYVVIASYNRVSIGFYNIAKVLTYAVLLKGKYVRYSLKVLIKSEILILFLCFS